MKIKLLGLAVLVLTVGFFSGCSKNEVGMTSESEEIKKEEIKNERQESVDSSLRVDDNNLIQTEKSSSESKVRTKSIQDLLNRNENLKCSWRIEKAEVVEEADIDNEDEDETGGVAEIVMYIAGEKFKQEIAIEENSRENMVNILNDGEMVYQWSSIIDQGVKMTTEKAQELGVIEYEKNYAWNCEKWTVDESIFAKPANIEFILMERK
jgi:hypothetical protein